MVLRRSPPVRFDELRMARNSAYKTMKAAEGMTLDDEIERSALAERAASDPLWQVPRPRSARRSAARLQLREVTPDDVAVFFEQQRDPATHRLVAFTAGAPDDRAAFEAHWARLLAADDIVRQTVVVEGAVAGHVLAFEQLGRREVSYWIGPAFRGRGVATRALALLLFLIAERPLHARVAKGHLASRRVLEKNGFRLCGEDRGYAAARGSEVEAELFELVSRRRPSRRG
jgi:RimJ/RimL family protein N-acetyltransferase